MLEAKLSIYIDAVLVLEAEPLAAAKVKPDGDEENPERLVCKDVVTVAFALKPSLDGAAIFK